MSHPTRRRAFAGVENGLTPLSAQVDGFNHNPVANGCAWCVRCVGERGYPETDATMDARS